MNYTDNQLKAALAKMLPDTLRLVPYEREDNLILCWNLDVFSGPVRNTELLHLCWLLEETLINDRQIVKHNQYFKALEDVLGTYGSSHATWQNRVIALAKAKGIEI